MSRKATLGGDDMKVMWVEDTHRMSLISKRLTDHDRGYIGITYVPTDKLEHYLSAVERVILKAGNLACAEDAREGLCDSNEAVGCLSN